MTEEVRDRWGGKLNGSNSSTLVLTNGTLTERDDYDTGTHYETRGINDQVSQ